MRIIILTTSPLGTAAHHLPVLASSPAIDIAAVLLSEGPPPGRNKRYSRVLNKIARIGILGALNGVRMRRWYGKDLDRALNLQHIEDTCASLGIRFEKVPFTNSPQTLQLFSSLQPDVAISLGNGYIAPKIFNIPRYGMLNIHHEILPEYQNGQSIIWQLYNSRSETGYTIHKINARIDEGDILFQEAVPISFKATLGNTVTATMAQLFHKSSLGLRTVLEDFDTYYTGARPQGKGKKYTTPSFRQYLRILKNFKRLKQLHLPG